MLPATHLLAVQEGALYRRVAWWLSRSTWPERSDDEGHGVFFTELAICFLLDTATVLPSWSRGLGWHVVPQNTSLSSMYDGLMEFKLACVACTMASMFVHQFEKSWPLCSCKRPDPDVEYVRLQAGFGDCGWP